MKIKQFDYLLMSEDFEIETKEGLQKEIREYYYLVLFINDDELIVMNINGLPQNPCVLKWAEVDKEYKIQVVNKKDIKKENLYKLGKSDSRPYNVGMVYTYKGKKAIELFEPIYFNGKKFVNLPTLDSKLIREDELNKGRKNE